tara:strand:+ start:295 stop:528 length:234 start_codon:yes stop_codon:yes gene_type:complete
VVITGAAGNIGSGLCKALSQSYHVIGLDRPENAEDRDDMIAFDETPMWDLPPDLSLTPRSYGAAKRRGWRICHRGGS